MAQMGLLDHLSSPNMVSMREQHMYMYLEIESRDLPLTL